MSRRVAALVLAAALVACGLLTGAGGAAARARPRSATWLENQLPGNWRWRADVAPGASIAGYGSRLSVFAGSSLALHVRTIPAKPYRIAVYRLGWYGGAGARLVACEPSCPGKRGGRMRAGKRFRTPPINPVTGELAAGWPITDRIHTRRSWVSGEYLAELVLAGGRNRGKARWVPFVVRTRRPGRNSILVEVPVDTWEAYNDWGGKSLYAYNSTGLVPAVKVSFDRPWAYGDDNFTFPVGYEYRVLQFMERQGFPLDYVTDIDVDRHPSLLLGHRLSVTLGHGEYWSSRIRSAWDAARDAGRNLAFLGADTGYWQMRYADAYRTIVEYRSRTLDPDPNPAQKTTQFRFLHPPLPECQLEGVEFQSGGIYPPFVNSYTVLATRNPWLSAAGLKPGEILHNAVRGEWDAVMPGCVTPEPTVLMSYSGRYPADVTVFHTPAGGRVLALGSEGFGALVDGYHKLHCSVNVRAEKFLRAALRDLSGLRRDELPPMPRACVRRQ